MVNDAHCLVFPGLDSGGVCGALHGSFIAELSSEQVGIRSSPGLLGLHLLLQGVNGVRGEVVGAEALRSALEGAGTLRGNRGRHRRRGLAGHGGMLDVDEAGANFGKGPAVGVGDTQSC